MRDNSFNLIYEICQEINNNSDSAKTLQNICKLITERMTVKFCLMSVYDMKEERLVLRAAHGLYITELEQYKPQPGITLRAFNERHAVNVPIMNEHIADDYFTNTIGKRINNVVAIPIISGNRAIGTITIGRPAKQVMPSKQMSILEAATAPLAMFLLNSPLTKDASGDSEQSKTSHEQSALACSETLIGRPIVSGVCYGSAMTLADNNNLTSWSIEKTDNQEAEARLLDLAYETALSGLQKNKLEINDLLSEADSSIFEMHEMLLADPTLRQRICHQLNHGYTLQSAISLTYREFVTEYQKVDDEYLRERLKDIEDVMLRLFNACAKTNVNETKSSGKNLRNLILVARELLPSQLVSSELREICGIVCETGGATSHAAILARALRIPMVVGAAGIMNKVTSGDKILLDGHSGNCYLRPTENLLSQFKQQMAATKKQLSAKDAAAQAVAEAEPPAREEVKTADGVNTHLSGNITLFSELPQLHAVGIRTIGLYRTEFMYLIRNAMPDENEQYRVLSRLVEGAKGASVTIRIVDIGGDKPLPYVKWDNEQNPSLGWRGLRFLLSNPDFLMPHLRAILRATVHGNVKIMFPMVADKNDLMKIKSIINEAKRSLRRDGIPFKNPALGIMLEVPSILFELDDILPEIDFASIGTNDLVQYLFAVDRGNAKVNKWYSQYHPIILRALRLICDKFNKYPDKELSLCGEMAGSIRAIPLLLGIGLRRFSMNSAVIANIRDFIEKLNVKDCEEMANQAIKCSNDTDVIALMTDFNKSRGMKPQNY